MTTLDSLPPESLIGGPILIGTFFNWGLHGALCVQIYFYYLSSHNDPTPLKCFVYILFLAEWIQTALLSISTFVLFMLNVNISLTDYIVDNLFRSAIPILSALIAAMVQIFYAWRIWILTARKLLVLALVIILLALFQLAAAIVSALRLTGSTPLSSYVTYFGGSIAPVVIWLVGSMLADVIIAISMSILLNRRKGVESESNILVTRLVKHIVGSGIATASVAVIALILWITDTFTLSLLADCPILVLSKLYACTALISLNNRDLVRRGEDEEEIRIHRRPKSEQRSLISKLRDRLRRVHSGQRANGLYTINPFAVDRGLETSLTESASHDVLMMESKMDPSVIDLTEA